MKARLGKEHSFGGLQLRSARRKQGYWTKPRLNLGQTVLMSC